MSQIGQLVRYVIDFLRLSVTCELWTSKLRVTLVNHNYVDIWLNAQIQKPTKRIEIRLQYITGFFSYVRLNKMRNKVVFFFQCQSCISASWGRCSLFIFRASGTIGWSPIPTRFIWNSRPGSLNMAASTPGNWSLLYSLWPTKFGYSKGPPRILLCHRSSRNTNSKRELYM